MASYTATHTAATMEPAVATAALEAGSPPALQKILLCTDFSLASQAATSVAIDLARNTGASMSVLHICEYGLYPRPSEKETAYIAEVLAREQQNLSNVVERIRKEGVEADGLTVTGHPPISIVEFIQSHRPNLAVVGTNGFGGLERMIFGSTAEAVFRHAACPVLIIGPRASAERQNGHGPVVFATDFHEPATQAARYAAALAEATSLPLHCLHVLPYSVELEGDPDVVATIMKEALHQVAKEAEIPPAKAVCDVLYDSEISHAVVRYAREHHAAFIVLGVRQGSALSSHLPPHLTYRIIATAPCPVLTVSPRAARLASDEFIQNGAMRTSSPPSLPGFPDDPGT